LRVHQPQRHNREFEGMTACPERGAAREVVRR
jgi:hypothetical protein